MLIFRTAKQQDLPLLIKMLGDDQLGPLREDHSLPLNEAYIKAFKLIDSDSNNELIVVENKGRLVGMLQLTFIPYLSHMGTYRCLIEAVRIHKNSRNRGLGTQLFEWAIDRAKNKGCKMVQLTSNKQRTDAIKFYQRLGFVASHEGLKLKL